MLTIDGLVEQCQAAARESTPELAVREVVARAVADPTTARLFDADRAAFDVLHRSDTLTVLHIGLPPTLASMPHDHRMWAVVGVLNGQEDNAFFLRSGDALEARGGRELQERDVLVMGDDTIHAIRNPRSRYNSAIHVYGGDLMGVNRSEWSRDGRDEHPYDEARIPHLVQRIKDEEERVGRGLSEDEVSVVLSDR